MVRVTLAACLLTIAAAPESGCARRQRLPTTVETPAIGWNAETGVDIQNFHGPVMLRVDPSVKTVKPDVVVRVSRKVKGKHRKEALRSVSVTTETVEDNGRLIVRVRSTTTWPDPDQVWVNIRLRVPRCDGALVWTRGGDVGLVGVSGAVQVDNGEMGGHAGRIEVRTDKPMTAPVALTTDKGSVIYQVGPDSSGQFELVGGGEDPPRFYSDTPHTQTLSTDGRSIKASLHGGTNPVVLRSGNGLVKVMVINDPVGYRDMTN